MAARRCAPTLRPCRAGSARSAAASTRSSRAPGWFSSFHCFTKYVKVTFFNGASLRPAPPGGSKHKDVRYLDIREDEPLDEAQFTAWMKQASRLPGWGKI